MVSLEKKLLFSKDENLKKSYINIFGDLRFGLLLEYLDLMAAETAIKHVEGKEISVVTAAADRIELLKHIPLEDLTAKSAINMVGNTSMETGIKIESEKEHLLTAYFTMVGVDKELKPAQLPPFVPGTEEEKKREQEAKSRKQSYLNSLKNSAEQRPFTGEETKLIFDTQTAWRKKEIHGIQMSETSLQNTLSMYPQDKNIHNKVFGGYIMRLAYELAWDTAYKFSRQRPLLVCVDRINFKKPIDIGSLVQFSSLIDYVGRTSISVEVLVDILNPNKNERILSNNCYFTFVNVDGERKPKEAPKVIPYNYEEMVKFVEGYRRHQQNKERRKKS